MTAKLQLTLGFHNFFFAEYLILYTQYSVRQALKSTLIRKVTGIEINITMTCPDWEGKDGLTLRYYSREN